MESVYFTDRYLKSQYLMIYGQYERQNVTTIWYLQQEMNYNVHILVNSIVCILQTALFILQTSH